jgi:flagellar protein FlbB
VVGTGLRIFALLLLVLVLLVGGLLWFDYLNLIDARTILEPYLGPLFEIAGMRSRTVLEEPEDPNLLDKERLKAQHDSLSLRAEELDLMSDAIANKEAELNQMLEELTEREKALEEREKSFNERIKAYENRRVNLEQKVNYFVGMPPDKAVAMFLEYDNDMDIIDIFRTADEMAAREGQSSLVPYWLSLMPPDRGAELTRKMGRVSFE